MKYFHDCGRSVQDKDFRLNLILNYVTQKMNSHVWKAITGKVIFKKIALRKAHKLVPNEN